MIVATIGQIQKIDPILNADRIESATVVCGHAGKWMGVVQKGDFRVRDLCVVFLQDALLPKDPRWAFMEKYHWRVRMQRFRGVPSECVIIHVPFDVDAFEFDVGVDIADLLGVTKYEKPIPVQLQGDVYGNFPSFIPKTDEPNFQAAPEIMQALVGKPYIATVKYDGTSCTVYRHEGHFGVCSRNWEMKPGPNIYWRMAEKYALEKLPIDELALQFEIIGPSIQGNPLGLKENEIRLFGEWSIESRYWWAISPYSLRLPRVETVRTGLAFPAVSDDELRSWAEGEYPNGRQREGIVIRTRDEMTEVERLSFKVVNLKYKEAQ